MMPRFRISSGSAPGYRHWRGFRNNQDAVTALADDNGLVALICDGCSQGSHSEVGAQLIVRFIANRALQLLQCNQDQTLWDLSQVSDRRSFLKTLHQATEQYLNTVVTGLAGDREQIIQSLFLFTVLGAVITPQVSFVFGQGDGIFQLNDCYQVIDQNNRPHYLAYTLLPRNHVLLEQFNTEFQEHAAVRTTDLQRLILASDGADILQTRTNETLRDGTVMGNLSQFTDQLRYIKQQSAISRRLNVISVLNRKGHDDISIVVIKREDENNEQANHT